MWFAIPISFLIAVCSGMGVGGGGLFMIFLVLVSDLPQLAAQGMNLLFFLFSVFASMTVHLTHRRLYPLLILLLILSGVGGVLLGTMIAEWLRGTLLRKLFGAMLVITGLLSLKEKAK